jgi:hypothetical protein
MVGGVTQPDPASFASYAGRPHIDEIELHVLDLLTLT